MKVVFLDVCGTVVNFQTANRFVEFVIKKTKKDVKFLIPCWKIIFKKFFGSKGGIKYKYFILKRLQGLKKEELIKIAKEYFEICMRPNINEKLKKLLERLRQLDYKIIIVSGGYDVYLNFLKEFIGGNILVSSELYFVNGIFTGGIKGLDCIGFNKILKLKEKGILINKLECKDIVTISDSFYDLPLFSLAKYKIVVNPDVKLSYLIGLNGWYSLDQFIKVVNKNGVCF